MSDQQTTDPTAVTAGVATYGEPTCRYCGNTGGLIPVTSVYEGDYYSCPPGEHRAAGEILPETCDECETTGYNCPAHKHTPADEALAEITPAPGPRVQPAEPASIDQQVAQVLHRLADNIVAHNLPLPPHFFRIGGCLDSRDDVQRWADYLGTTVTQRGTAGDIPYAEGRITPGGSLAVEVAMHGPKDTRPELERLREENEQLRAQLAEAPPAEIAEGGTR